MPSSLIRHLHQRGPIALAAAALLLALSGCFQKPIPLATDTQCTPAALVVQQALPAAASATAEQQLQPDQFTLFIWNSYKGKKDGWLADLSMLSEGHELLLLQEAYLKDDLLAFLDESGWNWSMATTFRYKTIPTGVLTASRITADLHCQLTALEPWIRLPKGILVSRYPLAGRNQKLVVVNVHLINFTINTGAYDDQLTSLKWILEQHDGPLVVAGDFNTWSSARSELVEEFMNDLELQPVKFNNHARSEVLGRKVDHVYFREMRMTSARVIEVTSSDHNPMAVTFSLQEINRAETHVRQDDRDVVSFITTLDQATPSFTSQSGCPTNKGQKSTCP